MRKIATLLILFGCSIAMNAQESEKTVKAFFDEALTDKTAFKNLETLCKNYKGRITGSLQAEAAVDFTFQIMKEMKYRILKNLKNWEEKILKGKLFFLTVRWTQP